METKIKKLVEEWFTKTLDVSSEYIPEEAIKYAVTHVLETSIVENEGYYCDSDIALACQTTIVGYLHKVK